MQFGHLVALICIVEKQRGHSFVVASSIAASCASSFFSAVALNLLINLINKNTCEKIEITKEIANEKDEIQKKNPKATIVPYDNSILKTQENSSSKAEPTMASAHTFAPFVISNILGYKFLKTHPHYGFIDESETKTYRQLSEGAGFEYAWHAHTQSHVDEENKWKIYKNALILQIIEKEGFSFDEIKDGFMFYYFSNIDESLIDETLEFLKPAIGPESLEKLKSNIKALNKARIKYNESSSLAKNTDEIKSIVVSISNTEDLQPNA